MPLQIGAAKLYNQIAKYVEPRAKKAGLVLMAKNEIMQQLQANGKASGTYTNSSAAGWADAAGDAKKLADAQKFYVEKVLANPKGLGWTDVTVDKTEVVITYAVEDGAVTPRSGNVALKYKYKTTYSGTNRAGQKGAMVTQVTLGVFAIQFEDARIQNMNLQE